MRENRGFNLRLRPQTQTLSSITRHVTHKGSTLVTKVLVRKTLGQNVHRGRKDLSPQTGLERHTGEEMPLGPQTLRGRPGQAAR